MIVNDPNLNPRSGSGTGAARARETRTAESGDDVHLSELVRSLRALAGESPERQARIEGLARAYALGRYQADAEGTAGQILHDALLNRPR